MIELILAALAITVPTSCAPAQDWNPSIAGYYYAGEITLGPVACRQLRQVTRKRCDRFDALEGVDTLAHELEHARQDRNGETMDEREAVVVAGRRAPRLLRRLERVFGRCASPFVSPDSPVTLTP